MTRFNRRQFLITSGAAATGAALLHGCGQSGSDQAKAPTSPAAPVSGGMPPKPPLLSWALLP
jgi:hypothetical protein